MGNLFLYSLFFKYSFFSSFLISEIFSHLMFFKSFSIFKSCTFLFIISQGVALRKQILCGNGACLLREMQVKLSFRDSACNPVGLRVVSIVRQRKGKGGLIFSHPNLLHLQRPPHSKNMSILRASTNGLLRPKTTHFPKALRQ